MRLINIFFALLLLVIVVILVDPNSRQKATALVQRWEPTLDKWEEKILVRAPSSQEPENTATPVPTVTPVPTELVDNDDEHLIPTTGGDDSEDEPIIQVNWDALQEQVKEAWNDFLVQLQEIKINIKKENK